jgi:DNA-binding NtrC family response regulator
MKTPTILVVDDDAKIRFAFKKTLEAQGVGTIMASNGREALKKVDEDEFSAVFLDISMPELGGLEALEEIRKNRPELPVIMITGYGTMQTAIRAMQLGAFDYLTKPLDIDKVRIAAQRAIEMTEMRQQITDLQRKLQEQKERRGTGLIGNNSLMQEVYKKIGLVSTTPNETTVLIMGETGTGKELVARAIHESSESRDEPFQAINCTVLPENLLESELFGHEKGAFTGADRSKPGKFELAQNGTLFLDEIGDMPESLQKKLLRVIQERSFERLGGNESIPLYGRIIAATHRDLTAAIQRGEFREDLYYRLNVIEIVLPPLREKRDDIPLLVHHFLGKYNERFAKNISDIDDVVLESFSRYDFPGNVRELTNLMERDMALERGSVLTAQSFPAQLFDSRGGKSLDIPVIDSNFTSAKQAVIEAFERKFLHERLIETQGNISEAARLSGIERQSFHRLMEKYNLSAEEYRRK